MFVFTGMGLLHSPLEGNSNCRPCFLLLPHYVMKIRNIVDKVPSFKDGGMLWFTDLSVPDSMYVFPVLTALDYGGVECPRRFGRQSLCWYDQEYLQRLCCTDCPTDCSISQCILCYWRFRRKSKGTREERKRLQHNTNGWWPTWRFPFQCAMK
ncbi:mitochondrial inner membrane protein OXA1-like isoform X1 [Andrographis paniculata]|uniref:mitochondrial inner membrane protein OXA1-like isoform X1 n=1 Tax=Andrographis paniculata TaxID=175694 RepID=UPI0021E99D3C|nr:mitochondrial inner membrane protein OXA1-like isoform X1 [Andrographis paniculata]